MTRLLEKEMEVYTMPISAKDIEFMKKVAEYYKEYDPIEFEVSGDKIEAVHMIPGWTHNIINLSDTENLVTVMTCNEIFNPDRPGTFFEKV